MSQIRINCPHCQQIDQVQKISAIYSGGLSNSQLSGNVKSSGMINYTTPVNVSGRINLTGQNQTYLSQRFTPPKRPSRPVGDLLKFTGIAIVLSLVTLIFIQIILNPKTLDIWSFIMVLNFLLFLVLCIVFIVLLLIWILNVYLIRTPRTTYQERLNHWQKLCIIWDTIYYCHRCNIVYDPNKPGQVSSVENVSQFYT